MNKTIITVVGKDTVGIIAKVCTYLADAGIEQNSTLKCYISLSGILLRRTTASAAGMPECWDGRPQLNCVGGTPYIVRKQRLK